MKTLAIVFAALVIAAKAFAIPVVMVDTNGVLEHPPGASFFSANRQALTNELEAAGYSPGGGAGSPYAALTNASQAFAPGTTNTFHGRVDLKGDVYVGTSNLIAKIIALDAAIAGKADSDPDLTALAGLATTGILSRTGAGAYATRAITGDSEIVVANGDGVAGAPTLSLGAGIARVAAVAASYQPIATILSRLSGIGLGTAGDVLIRDTLGWTNLAKGSDGFVFTIVSGIPGWAAPGGGSGGNANTNVAQTWTAPQVFNTPVTNRGPTALEGTTTVSVLAPATIIYDGVWDFPNGGLGATTAAGARTNLGLVPDVDVQVFRLPLLQIAMALDSSGKVPRRLSSGIVSNMVVDDAALSLLAATTAAGQRAAIGAAALAGDTFTGPVIVPYLAFNPDWTNNAASNNAVMTRRAAAEQFKLLSSGGTYFSSVDPADFTNDNGNLEFAPAATVGTGKLVRESSVTGGTQAISNQVDAAISGPVKGQALIWNGTQWENTWISRLDMSDDWNEIYTPILGNGGAQALDPFASANINNGNNTTTPGMFNGRAGYWRAASRLSSTDQWSGGNLGLSGSTFSPTNTMQWRAEFCLMSSAAVVTFVGFYDDLTTNAPTDALMLTVTNTVAAYVGYAGGSKVVASTTFTISTNVWYTAKGFFTNGVSTLRLYTNHTDLAWSETLSSGVPYGEANILGFGVRAISTGPASTNNTEIVSVDSLGIRWTNPDN